MNGSVVDKLFASGRSGFSVAGSGHESLDAADLAARVRFVSELLARAECRCVALFADNGVDWIVSDLACQRAGIRIIPLPLFFSDAQLRFTLRSSGIDALITDQATRLLPLIREFAHIEEIAAERRMKFVAIHSNQTGVVPPETSKITFTSGTTGEPKGVCLSSSQQLTVAESLVATVGIQRPRHLCLLPLSTLLENVAGVYAPLLADGSIIAPSLAELGLNGSSRLNIRRLAESISRYQPDTIILVPEMLNALTVAARNGWTPPATLKFVAVGGAKTAPSLLRSAQDVGLPVCEGYGLSECGSVVSLNRPGEHRPGAVGRPLAHAEVHVENGEIVVEGLVFLGYPDQPESWYPQRVHTGDLGHVDPDGYLHVDGRKRALLISSFGRNISPEWVESEFLAGSLLQQAVVFGDARAYCVAIISARDAATTDRQIEDWIEKANARLPDYARVEVWHRLYEPLSHADGLITDNGRPRREQIEKHYQQILADMFDKPREVMAV